MERRGEFRASQLSDQPVGLSRCWTATASPLVSMRMANAQARFENLAVILQYGVLCCQSFRIKVFGDLAQPGQRRDIFGAAGPKRDFLEVFLCCLCSCSHILFFFLPKLHFLNCIIISNPPVDPVFRRSRIGDRCSKLRAIEVQGTGLPLRQLPSGMGERLAERQ